MRKLSKRMTNAYAHDIFRIMAQELRMKNTWRKYANDVIIVRQVLGDSASDQTKLALDSIKHSQAAFEKYVRLVDEEGKVLDPASSGAKPKPILNAADWANALRTLPRVFELLDSHFMPIYAPLKIQADAELRSRSEQNVVSR